MESNTNQVQVADVIKDESPSVNNSDEATEKVIVTGGAGFIGSTLVPMLLERGYEVTIYDNFRFGSAGLFPIAHHPRLHVINGDICEREKLTAAIRSHDAVVHLAGIVGFPACSQQPELATAVNIEGTRNVVDALLPMQKLVFASTGSCYGAVEGVCTEETPLNPLTLYGSSKLDGEKMCLAKNGIALRLATLFGVSPRLRMDLLVNSLTYTAACSEPIRLYQAHFRRTFLHVRDACRAFCMAIEQYSSMRGMAYNVGSEKMNLTKKELAQKIQEALPSTYVDLCNSGEDFDQRDYEVSYKRIREHGFEPTTTVEDGIRELLIVYAGISKEDVQRASNV